MITLKNPTENGIKKDVPEQENVKQEAVRLDDTVKLLFELSKPTLVKTLNALFHENYEPDKVEISLASTEYHKNDLSLLRADICLTITEYEPHHYHAEIQTEPHKYMAFRMFEYDMLETFRNYRLQIDNNTVSDTAGEFMPKSIVIQIEDGKSVPKDYYTFDLRLANGGVAHYTVPVLRYFEYDDKRLIKEHLYNLLPLQIFKMRAELDKMTKDGNEAGRQEAILKARDITDKITRTVINLRENQTLNDIDIDKLMIAIYECFQHLNNRYDVNENLNQEVEGMVRTLIDKTLIQEAENRKAVEIAKKMLLKNKPIEEIIEFTGLTEPQIMDIKKTVEMGD